MGTFLQVAGVAGGKVHTVFDRYARLFVPCYASHCKGEGLVDLLTVHLDSCLYGNEDQ